MLALRSQRPLNIAHAHGADMQQRRGARQLRDEDEHISMRRGRQFPLRGGARPITAGQISCSLPPRPLQVEGFAHD